MATYLQTDRPLAVTTPLGKDVLLLTGLTGREAISELFQFELDLLAENGTEVPFDKLLGQKVTVAIRQSDKEKRHINGIVCRISQGSRDQTFTRYRAVIAPQFWFLTRKIQSRIFQHIGVPEILKKVLAGLDVAYEIQGTFNAREYCAQYNESDFAFASRLMEEEGIYYFFKHTDGGHTLVLANTPQSHSATTPANVIYEEIEGGNRPEERVCEWEKTQELRSGKYTLWDNSFELPGKHLEADKPIIDTVQAGKVSHKFKVGGNDKLEIYNFPGGYANRYDGVDRGGGERPADLQKIFDDNKRTVELRMQAEATLGLEIRGGGTCPTLTPGFRFMLERHFDADGSYVLTSVSHKASLQQSYRADATDSVFEYDNSFTCIPLALPFRPARVTRSPRVNGAQTATVVGPAGEEIFTDKYGRVKVQFHWDREGKNDGDSSCWLRVASPMAGKQWGMIHIPRIGQEVLVDFIEGDIDAPIIVGNVYNADQMPPYALPANKTQSGIKTRSTLKGAAANFNEIRFEDKKGNEQLFIHAEKNQDIEVENDETHWVGHDRKKTIDNDETTHIKHDLTETIDNNRAVTISMGNDSLSIKMGNSTTKLDLGASKTEAMQSIELKVGQSSVKLDQMGVTIKGMMVQIEGQTTVNVKGLMTQVQGTAMLTLKGGLTTIN